MKKLRLNSKRLSKNNDQLHLMPFSIDYEGEAQISKYFIIQSLPTPVEKDQQPDQVIGYLESSFRGRYLHGTQIKIPSGYHGLLCSSHTQSSSRNHQQIIKSISQPIIHPPQSSNSRSTARGRGRGRARGKKLNQSIGTRSNFSRVQLKRKHQELDGFLSDDDDDNVSTEIKKPKESDQEDNKELESNTVENVVKLVNNQVSVCEDSDSVKIEEPLIQVEIQTNPKHQTDHPSINPMAPDPTLSVIELNDSSRFDGSKIIQSIGSFDHLTIWNPDGPIDFPSDVYARSIVDWIGLAPLLHSIPPLK